MQCRSHAAQLGRLYRDFKAANCEIILILGDSIEKAKRYAKSLHLPFPVLADPERKVYHQYGLEKAMIFIQRTASIVIDQSGTICYIKNTTSPMVWLQESRELISFVKSMPKDDRLT
jgi:peroxiredoxin